MYSCRCPSLFQSKPLSVHCIKQFRSLAFCSLCAGLCAELGVANMINGVRKSEGGSGSTPTPKQPKTDDWMELDEDQSAKDMMKQMWGMMRDMKQDSDQALVTARLASESAESAHVEIKGVKTSISTIEQDIKHVRTMLTNTSRSPQPATHA